MSHEMMYLVMNNKNALILPQRNAKLAITLSIVSFPQIPDLHPFNHVLSALTTSDVTRNIQVMLKSAVTGDSRHQDKSSRQSAQVINARDLASGLQSQASAVSLQLHFFNIRCFMANVQLLVCSKH
jgi:hypothetical protein